MLKLFKKFHSNDKELPQKFDHDVLGLLLFAREDGYWETEDSAVFHSVPGDADGPTAASIDFILDKLEVIDRYFELCSDELLSIAHGWDTIDKSLSVKELFELSAISVVTDDNRDWEICFETKPQYKWIHVGLHFENDEIVANDITT